jgi:hypothetical protein
MASSRRLVAQILMRETIADCDMGSAAFDQASGINQQCTPAIFNASASSGSMIRFCAVQSGPVRGFGEKPLRKLE